MVEKTKLSLVVGAAAGSAPVGKAKEPPRRPVTTKPVLAFSAVSGVTPQRTRAFNYNWEERLDAVNPNTHPMMQFTQYQLYKDRLFEALEILNATGDVNTIKAGRAVLGAFKRLRDAANNQNRLDRLDNRGCSEFQMTGHDLKALVDVATYLPKGSKARTHVESEWMNNMLKRDNARDGQQLRTELMNAFNNSIPKSDKAALYESALKQLSANDIRARLNEHKLELNA